MDRIDARTVIETYMHGVDAKDASALLATFHEDAEAVYHKGTPQERRRSGGRIIVDEIAASIRRFTASNHSISNFVVRLEGDLAHTDTFAIAHVVLGERLLVRGLRYQDVMSRTATGFVIHRRVHTPLWQTELATVPPMLA